MDVHPESTPAYVCYFVHVLRKGACGIMSLIIVTFRLFYYAAIALNLCFYDSDVLIWANKEETGFEILPL
jgi:hypothetical protein